MAVARENGQAVRVVSDPESEALLLEILKRLDVLIERRLAAEEE